ncbi:MAG: hypothetical protein UY31_C0016G0010 [Candidatus Wolfebacteria bacterium GW2011_GWE1_48_7]|uniref:Uncharacterized protein n=1 Tax=Candidatus Wolfebacteria bacterium GW2011_GWA2_47_9b TaxID=1619005 RepID=A0A0G1U537_9BACT|nr:MAG: hypothetical protein UX49_C0010G0032 [Candidatus Wolfebacteria bacterium GW2011_GWC2_46_275]KKU89186.1 MAG: hypothetical protein UY19_C0018G0031 [Candidatus Wolfebacteria bacterium GW2011_GWA2_47_9b]KKU99898.1 MAG: hypothetical protein UY31_C0016G0010 [Candidatus Wolfebacteria bacterium GW2011_GWE1_48_7]HCM53248.1 hypothetical protein [Candidatus Wolfebacteria bacterium]
MFIEKFASLMLANFYSYYDKNFYGVYYIYEGIYRQSVKSGHYVSDDALLSDNVDCFRNRLGGSGAYAV